MADQRISRLHALQAFHAGIDSGQEDKPVTTCPYDVRGSLTQQFLAYWWVKGWRRGTTLNAEVPQT